LFYIVLGGKLTLRNAVLSPKVQNAPEGISLQPISHLTMFFRLCTSDIVQNDHVW